MICPPVRSQTRMFADDCLLYRPIRSIADHVTLQRDLDVLSQWANTWGMRFNASKCYVMRISRAKKPSTYTYVLCGQSLSLVAQNPYLGVLLSDDMKWTPHINKTTTKANQTLGFIRRNLAMCNKDMKSIAYRSLVRPLLEYCCSVWDPYLQKDSKALESVQRRAARFIANDYDRTSSVSAIMNKLDLCPLAERRRDTRLTLFFKVVNGLVAVPAADYLIHRETETRKKHNKTFNVFAPKTEIFRNSFFPKTVKDWNSCSEQLVQSMTLEEFKNKIHQ